MNGQWLSTWSSSSASGVMVYFSSEQLIGNRIHDYNGEVSNSQALAYWNNGNYKLELFDRLGNSVTGWKVDHASWDNSNFYLYLKDVPDGYPGFYAKVSRDGNLGVQLTNNNTVYYTTAYDASEKYGAWGDLGRSNVWFNDLREINAYYCFGSYSYPVTVTITKPYDTIPIDTFTASKATNGNFYYFTASDLSKTDPKEAYRITAVSVDGSSRSEIGYLGVRGGQTGVVKPTGVTLSKTKLSLQLGQSEKLNATVKPDNATNKNVTWTSDNKDVAAVDAQGNVTATGVGTATIKATTDNGKAASCTVTVSDYTLTKTALKFDLSTEEGGKPQQLNVLNGGTPVTSNITWSTTDESVATVAKDGTVTPVDSGAARILAAIKDGPTLSCEVTVTNDALTSVGLSELSCELYLDTDGNAVPQKPNTKSLKAFYSPGKAEIKDVEWTITPTTNPPVVSVAKDSDDPTKAVITALSKGTADITVTVTTTSGSEKSATCKVTVKTVTSAGEAEKALPQGLTALTNEQLVLGDVSLDDFPGWAWLEEDRQIALTQFAGMQTKSFAATYTKSDAEPYETAVPIAFSTVTGISVQSESSTVQKGQNAELSVIWNMNGTQPDMSEYIKRVEWSSNKPAVASVQKDADGKAVLSALTAGSATITAQIKFKNNKTYKAQYKISVTEDTPADIQVTNVDGFTADASAPGSYRGKLSSDAAGNSGAIHITLTNASKLTVKNSNPKVTATGKVNKVNAETGEYVIPLTIKAAGMTKITLAANDKAKTQKDIFLYVTDSKPSISEDTVTINLQQTGGAAFTLYPNAGYQVSEAALSGENANKFTLASDNTAQGRYILTAGADTAKGTYKLTLCGKVRTTAATADDTSAEETFENVAFTVNVVDQKPKYKIKQSTKFNLFYKDWESRLEITTDEILNDMELKGCDFRLKKADGAYYLTAPTVEGLPSTCAKKGKLTLTFEGYQPVEIDFTVATEYKKPKITLAGKSATLYPENGITNAVITLKEGKDDYTPTAAPALDNEAAKLFSLTQDGDSLLLAASAPKTLPKSVKATISLLESNWAEAIKLVYTVKVSTAKPGVKLGKTTLQLNANPVSASYDTAATQIMWKDGATFNPSHVSFSAANAASRDILNRDITFTFDDETDQIIVRLNKAESDKTIKTGSYKFKVNVIKDNDGRTVTVSTPLTVKITNVEMAKAIKVSSKGSIDVLNRENTFVTVTPSLKSINGTVTNARLSGSAAHLFEIDSQPIKDNKIILRAKADTALITKYAYKLRLNLTIENAEGDKFYYLTPNISLKLKQGKPKVTIAPKNATFFSGAYNNAVTRSITATLKGADNPAIENVELLNNKDEAFTCIYNEQNGTFALSSTDKAVKGKSYSLQLKVTFKDQADNEKATVVKYSVKVK